MADTAHDSSGALRFLRAALRVPARALHVFGPIFDKELRVSSRRRRNYVLRASYLLLLTTFVGLAWWGGVVAQAGPAVYRQTQMPELGRSVVATVVIFQFVALQIVAAMMLSTSVSEEVDRRTLGVLMATPVRNTQIVLGKLFSKLLQLALLVAACLPLLLLVRIFGGVPWGFLLRGLSITATAVLFVGCLSMFFSTVFRQGYVAALVTLGVLVAIPTLYGLLAMLVAAFDRHASLIGSRRMSEILGVTMTCLNPSVAIGMEVARLFSPGGLPVPWWTWLVHCGVMLGLSAGLLAWSARRVRVVGVAMATGALGRRRSRRRGSSARASSRRGQLPRIRSAVRRVRGSPLIWRELRTRLSRRRWMALAGLITVSTIVVLLDLVAAAVDGLGGAIEVVAVILTVALTMLGLVAAVVPAAVSIAGERAARTFAILLATPVTDGHVVVAKLLGAVRRSAPAWVPLGVHLLALTVFRWAHVVALMHVAIVIGGVTVFLAGAGLLLSACLRRTSAAVLLSVGLVLALWGVLPLAGGLVGEVFGEGEEVSGAILCVNPVVQTGVAVTGAAESGSYRRSLEYDWPPPIRRTGWAGSLVLVGATAAGHMAAGLALAAGAWGLLRWRT
jgi:ABC-type transport system involved in multi-copper enzyme maturation permease subunit